MRLTILFAASAVALAGFAAQAAAHPRSHRAQELSSYLALVGTYQRTDGGNALSGLTLNADGSYASDDVVQCFRAPCLPIRTTGSWRATGAGFSGTLYLTPAGGSETAYAFTEVAPDGSLELSAGDSTIEEGRIAATCGGIAALQCAAGFSCVMPDGATYPDAAGQCLPRGAQGTMCGGFAALPCMDGLTCVVTDTYPDAAGTCQ